MAPANLLLWFFKSRMCTFQFDTCFPIVKKKKKPAGFSVQSYSVVLEVDF